MMMTDVQSVAANTTTANILAGKNKEFLEEASILRFGIAGSAVGLRATVVVGTEVVIDDQELPVATTLPAFPDQVIAEAGGFAGDRITIRLRNTTGGAITGYTKVLIEPA